MAPTGGGFGSDTCNGCNGRRGCEHPTEPIATTGLCLNGQPIAVVITRDCCARVRTEGWVDLATGTYTEGEPPEGAEQCKQEINLDGAQIDVSDLQLDPGTRCESFYVHDNHVSFLRTICRDRDGNEVSRTDTTLDGTPHDPDGEVRPGPLPDTAEEECCEDIECESTVLHDNNDDFLRVVCRDASGTEVSRRDETLDGEPYTPDGEVRPGPLPDETEDESAHELDPTTRCETLALHDGSCTEFVRTICRDADGQTISATDTALDGETPYTPTGANGETGSDDAACVTLGPSGHCDCEEESGESWGEYEDGAGPVELTVCETILLHDSNGDFARIICRNQHGEEVSRRDETLDGEPYEADGDTGAGGSTPCCPSTTTLTLCDAAGPFLRHVTRTPEGATATADTTLTGATYAPVGEVGVCQTGAPIEESPVEESDTDTPEGETIVEKCRYQGPEPGEIQTVTRTTVISGQTGETIYQTVVDEDGQPYEPTGIISDCERI